MALAAACIPVRIRSSVPPQAHDLLPAVTSASSPLSCSLSLYPAASSALHHPRHSISRNVPASNLRNVPSRIGRANDCSANPAEVFPGKQSFVDIHVNASSYSAATADVQNPTSLFYTDGEFQANSSVTVPTPGVSQVEEEHAKQMREWIETIREMFHFMALGEISVSPYDTAWVALVPALDGSKGPQFPKLVEWLIKNQLPDGSWGDRNWFLAYDRVCSTLACVLALKTWNMGHENIKRGVEFIHGNLAKMEAELDDYMPIGFEIVFPGMLEDAKEMGIHLPYDSQTVKRIQDERERKLKRIPMDLLHNYPTTLLHSLEGLHRIVDWNKLLNLQCKNGSFLFSPASTSCALRYTRDHKCLEYLNAVLEKFDNAVPSVYPVDMFEHLWVVDRLERLGISRYFKREIKKCLDYVYRYWTDRGIAWASESHVYDVDDTAMGFRLLRLHGYDVSPDVFERFKQDGQFFCFEGQTSQAVTGMYNLYRASQTMLPGETILQEIKEFTTTFLQEKLKKNEILDKWIIAKGLHGEVEYALNYPWYASLQRIETRQYLEQYGVDDVWIGKSLYKMPYVNNETFLKLAKADYNLCQSFHQKELAQMVRWNKECQFDQLKFARQKTIECYFSIATTMFEPEFALARLVWTRCSVLATIIDDFFDVKGYIAELTEFSHAIKSWDPSLTKGFSQDMKILFMGLYNTLNTINQEAFIYQGRDILSHLRQFWVRWIDSILIESKWTHTHYFPSFEEYMDIATPSGALEPIVQSSLFFVGEILHEEVIMDKDYYNIMQLVNIVGRLNNDIRGFKRELSQEKCSSVNIYMKENEGATEEDAIQHCKLIIEQNMALLVHEFLRETRVPRPFKEVHLNMARIMNFFYLKTDGFSSLTEMTKHVNSIIYVGVP